MTDLVILGTGGHGREALDILRSGGGARLVGFLDENEKLHGTQVQGLAVLGGLDWLERNRRTGLEALIAIGNTAVILDLSSRLQRWGVASPRAVSPRAVVSEGARIGAGSILFPHTFVSTGAELAEHVSVNVGASVSHDVRVGKGVLLQPGARLAGSAVVGEGSMIGMGALVLQGRKVGARCVIGAGAVVIDDIPDGATAVGVPAKVIRRPS